MEVFAKLSAVACTYNALEFCFASLHTEVAEHRLQTGIYVVYLSNNPFHSELICPAAPREDCRPTKWMETPSIVSEVLAPPIVELPFDIWRGPNGETIVREHNLSIQDACTPEIMVRFGRPLYVSFLLCPMSCIHIHTLGLLKVFRTVGFI